MDFYKNNKNYIIKLLTIIIFLLFIYVFMNYLFLYIAPFIFGYIISLIIRPVSQFLKINLKLNTTISILISIILLISIISTLGSLIIGKIIKEGIEFFKNMPNLLVYVDNVISSLKIRFNAINSIIPIEFQETVNNLKCIAIESITKMVGSFVKSFSTKIVSKVPKVIIGFILGLVSSYFFTKDRNIIINFFSKLVPKESKNSLNILKKNTLISIVGYLKAQLIIMSIVSFICIIGLSILKVSYAIFLGFLIGIVDALPIFGSGFFYWPWIIFSFITKDYYNTIGLSIIYILVFITRHIMEPKIVGKQVGIHPLAALISIYIGLNIFGFLGIILGPCITVVIKSILDI